MTRTQRRDLLATLAFVLVVSAAAPAVGASPGLGDTSVSPTAVSTGETTTLDLSVNATGVNTADGTAGANVTVTAPAALDLSAATATASGASPNATGVSAAVDGAANAVVVSWDDDAGIDAETVAVTVTVSGVAVARTGDHDLTATVDADGDGRTDASGAVGTVTASATGSDRSVTDGGVVYLGEEAVDLTRLDGVAPAGDSQRFYGTSTSVEGELATVDDTLTADVTADNGFGAGTYGPAGDVDASALTVEHPNVTDVDLYPGDTAAGTDIAGSSTPPSVGTLTVDPQFDFAAADDATVVVEDADGLELTGELTADPTVSESGEPVRLDVSDLEAGTYTVRVEGATDLDHVNATTTIRIRPEARTVSLSRTQVPRGEATVATVSGSPGDVRHVRVPADALRDGESVTVATAEAVFGAAEGLVAVGADTDADALYAVVGLDDDGFAKVELETERLAEGTHDIEAARNATADAEATVPLTVTDRRLSMTPNRSTLTVGETVTVSGTARGADEVKLYARVGGEYAPLYADTDTDELAETRVDGDSWDVDLDTRAVVNVSGSYRVAAVADPGEEYLGSTARISESTLRGFDTVVTTAVETVPSSPTASVSQPRIATGVGDEVTITGTAPGPGETVRAYVVSPRGVVDPRDVDVAADDTVEFDYDGFEAAGRYRILLVTTGRDATFGFADGGDAAAIRSELSGSETPDEAVAVVRDAYGGAGVDDPVVALNVTATDPQVAVEAVRRRANELVVAGTSNRENGTVILVDLRDGTRVAAAADAEVNASGRWRTTVDVSTVDAGRYTLRAETVDATDTRTVRVGDASSATPVPTATVTPMDTPTATTTPPATDAAAAGEETRRATDRTARTETSGDGFGLLPAVAAALAGLLVAAGRRR
jgi:hypothetical protein